MSPPLERGAFGQQKDAGYVPSAEERQAAFFAHLFAAIAAFLSAGVAVGVLAPYLACVVTKQRGPFVLFHVNQAVVFQLGVTIASVVVGASALVCCITVVGLAVTWLALGVGYPIYVATKAQEGAWEEYVFVGRRVLRDWPPFFT